MGAPNVGSPHARRPPLRNRVQYTIARSIEGPIGPAVWKLAWPTMLQNVIAGLQGIIDHAMVGHFVGYAGNAAIGVSWQIILVVIVFISSVFTGMAVLVARFAGANQPDKVNRVVYQAFLTAVGPVDRSWRRSATSQRPSLLDIDQRRPGSAGRRRCRSCARCSWASSA